MAKKFNLSNKSSSKTLGEKAKILENKSEFDFRQIPFDEIKVNNKNFYNVTAIEDLAQNIKENGLMHNIEVLDISNSEKREFRILSGERRYQAIKYLRETGIKFDTIPCKVIKGLNEIDEEIHLIKGNSDTRIISEEEKRKQIERLNELYNIKNKHQGTKINAKKEIAKELQVSERTIERYNNINNKLIPELQEFFDNKLITLTEGDKFAKLDEQVQFAILEVLKQQSKISKEELEIIKNENNKLIEEKYLKEKQIKEKEDLINNYQKINNELEEKERHIKIKLEEKEKEKLLIREQLAKEFENNRNEEIDKLNEKLKIINEEKEKLLKSEKENAERLKNNNIQLENKISELENKLKFEATQQKELIKKEFLNEKVQNLRKIVIKDILELANLITDNNLDLADETILELERTINVFKYKNKENRL